MMLHRDLEGEGGSEDEGRREGWEGGLRERGREGGVEGERKGGSGDDGKREGGREGEKKAGAEKRNGICIRMCVFICVWKICI